VFCVVVWVLWVVAKVLLGCSVWLGCWGVARILLVVWWSGCI